MEEIRWEDGATSLISPGSPRLPSPFFRDGWGGWGGGAEQSFPLVSSSSIFLHFV